jgi:hypothetical protein
VLAADVGRVRFRFFDEGQWRDSFNSRAAGRLPRAIEIAVWLGPLDADASDATRVPALAPDAATDPDGAPPFGADDADPASDPDADDTPPRPADRLRVFAIPDAAAEDSDPAGAPANTGGAS